jgi:hypothetical protein
VRPPPGGPSPGDERGPRATPALSPRILCLIPAHNEAASLQAVVWELRARRPDLDVLVIEETAILSAELRELRAAQSGSDDRREGAPAARAGG